MELFPLAAMSVTLADGTTVSLSASDVQSAQRYPPFAWGPLLSWCRRHTAEVHRPPHATEAGGGVGWDVAVAAGSMSSVEMAIALLLEPANDQGKGDRTHCTPLASPASLPP